MKIQRTTVTGKGQNVRFHQVGSIGKYRIELDIKTDTYKNQGHAIARVWSPDELKWNVVSHIDPHAMQTEADLGYKPTPASANDFKIDRAVLLEEVKFVLRLETDQ